MYADLPHLKFQEASSLLIFKLEIKEEQLREPRVFKEEG